MFPFLIGKVLTPSGMGYKKYSLWFPFLIGKVLTYNPKCTHGSQRTNGKLFPFLIGKVLTPVNIPDDIEVTESFHSL